MVNKTTRIRQPPVAKLPRSRRLPAVRKAWANLPIYMQLILTDLASATEISGALIMLGAAVAALCAF